MTLTAEAVRPWTAEEKRQYIQMFAFEKMKEHGLFDFDRWDGRVWGLCWDKAPLRRAGQCRPGKREIGLSVKLLDAITLEGWEDVVLHEIAHALTVGHGHDRVWKATARAIGADPTSSVAEGDLDREKVPYKWTGTCMVCEKTWNRHRLNDSTRRNGQCTNAACRKTTSGLVSTIVWKENR